MSLNMFGRKRGVNPGLIKLVCWVWWVMGIAPRDVLPWKRAQGDQQVESAFDINRLNPLGTSLILKDFFLWEHDVESLARPILWMLPKKTTRESSSAPSEVRKGKGHRKGGSRPGDFGQVGPVSGHGWSGSFWILTHEFFTRNLGTPTGDLSPLEVMVICGNGH